MYSKRKKEGPQCFLKLFYNIVLFIWKISIDFDIFKTTGGRILNLMWVKPMQIACYSIYAGPKKLKINLDF